MNGVNQMWRSLYAQYLKSIECYVDANFVGGWDQSDADTVENVIFCTVYVITYAG